jgi:hypothetical protein
VFSKEAIFISSINFNQMRKVFLRILVLLPQVFLFSCNKNASLSELSPAKVEATSVLQEWANKNDKLNQANLIDWTYATPITLADSIKGYSVPLKSSSGNFTEFITFELGGKRHGWYKSYKRLNETDMEIIIRSIEGKTLRSGFLHKNKSN